MTRETALRRMLAGTIVEHPDLPRYFFAYNAKLDCPIIRQDKHIRADYLFMGGELLPYKTGWKEYKKGVSE